MPEHIFGVSFLVIEFSLSSIVRADFFWKFTLKQMQFSHANIN